MDKLANLLKTIGAPILATAVGGPIGTIAGAAIGALADALGTAATPEAVASKLETAPIAETGPLVRAVEADKGPEYLAELQARLADVQDARRTQIELVEKGSPLAWSTAIISVIVTLLFAAVVILMLLKPVEFTPLQTSLLNIMLGGLVVQFAQVVNYYLGSSAGSARNGDAVRALAQQANTPTTGQIVGQAVDAAAAKAAGAVVAAATAKR